MVGVVKSDSLNAAVIVTTLLDIIRLSKSELEREAVGTDESIVKVKLCVPAT